MTDHSSAQAPTPGPWRAVEEGLPEDRLWRVYSVDPNANEGDSLICEVNPLSGDDARLIAAAPELLQSAELLESLCTWLLHARGPDSPEGKEAAFRAKQARGAIAKARGETS